MLLGGVTACIVTEIYSAVMQREFQNTDNRVGKGFAVLGIYLFVVFYCMDLPRRPDLFATAKHIVDGLINSTTWLYGAEVVPVLIRSRMVGISAIAHYVVNVARKSNIPCAKATLSQFSAVTEAGPSAFSTIHENYYYVFVGCCAVYFVLIYLYFPETNQKTLEEIAASFGDRLVDINENHAEAGYDGEKNDDQAWHHEEVIRK